MKLNSLAMSNRGKTGHKPKSLKKVNFFRFHRKNNDEIESYKRKRVKN